MTTKQLNDAKITTLTEYYNELAESIGKKALKSFKDRETAIKRIGEIQGEVKAKEAADKKAAKEAAKPAKEPQGKGKKTLKSDNPLDKEPKGRGAVAKFDYEPAERQTAPRPGTLRGRAFEMLQVGTTPEELEDLVVTFWKEKGLKEADQKIGKRLRALELVRLLRYQNGYGFAQDKDGTITVLGDLTGSKPTTETKASKKKAEKAAKEAKPKKSKKTDDDVL